MQRKQTATALILMALLLGCASNNKVQEPKPEKGPDGTIAYYVQIEASDEGVRIEANGEYVGQTPCELKIWADKDGTFHNFGRYDYTIRAIPSAPGHYAQTKVFRTGGWFTQEDRVPKRIYFEMALAPGLNLGPTGAQAQPKTESSK